MLTATPTPHAARVDLTALSDADLLGEYSVYAYDFSESVTPGNQRSDRYGRREDAYAKQVKLQVKLRAYGPAYRAALAHPAIHTVEDAEIAAEAAIATILDSRTIESVWASCTRGKRLEDIAAHRATSELALDEVHKGTQMKEQGARSDLDGSKKPETPEEKAEARANRRIYGADPQSYGFEAGRSISSDGLSYDLTALEDSLDQLLHGSLTENEEVIEWFIEAITSKTAATRDEVMMWLHTAGITDEVQEYIDLVAGSGSPDEANRLEGQRRFPLKDIAALTGESLATVKRRQKRAKDATYADCTLVGDLRSGVHGTRTAEVNPKTVSYALQTSLEAHAAASGQALTKAMVAAVPDTFFADYIAEYRADGSTAADIDLAFITEMRDAVTQAVKA